MRGFEAEGRGADVMAATDGWAVVLKLRTGDFGLGKHKEARPACQEKRAK